MKTCTKCEELKAFDQFRRQSKSNDGLQSACKDCQKARDKRDYAKPGRKGQIVSGRIRLRAKNRKIVWDYLETHPCVDCNNDDIVVLQFDHVRDTKVANVAKMITSYATEKLLEEIKKCDVRCANCHTKKTAKQFGWLKALASKA